MREGAGMTQVSLRAALVVDVQTISEMGTRRAPAKRQRHSSAVRTYLLDYYNRNGIVLGKDCFT
jgi:hypothetical protein